MLHAEKDGERVRQLSEQYHALVGPHRQLESDSMASWLTSHGLPQTVSVSYCPTVSITWLTPFDIMW